MIPVGLRIQQYLDMSPIICAMRVATLITHSIIRSRGKPTGGIEFIMISTKYIFRGAVKATGES